MNNDLLYNWDLRKISGKRIELNDETLRDGLQATYVSHPTLEQKTELLHIMDKLNIQSANIGFPIAGPEHKNDIIALINYSQRNKLKINLECGGRVLKDDVEAIIDVSQKTGVKLEAGLFIASSKIRHLVEDWNLEDMAKMIKDSISLAVKNNLDVMFVTEDTTRAHPDTIKFLYHQAIDSGATRICISDTVGCANPWLTEKLIKFFKNEITNNTDVKIDWHGHNDRGMAVANSLAAAHAGADRIQATALGVGERSGNTSMIELLVNLYIENFIDTDLHYLQSYANKAADVLGISLPANMPIIGTDAFKTATGVHAAAIKKALDINDKYLAGLVYSAIDPIIVGRDVEILVGPMSGKANVEHTLKRLHLPAPLSLVIKILDKAKSERRILKEEEIIKIAHEFTNQS